MSGCLLLSFSPSLSPLSAYVVPYRVARAKSLLQTKSINLPNLTTHNTNNIKKTLYRNMRPYNMKYLNESIFLFYNLNVYFLISSQQSIRIVHSFYFLLSTISVFNNAKTYFLSHIRISASHILPSHTTISLFLSRSLKYHCLTMFVYFISYKNKNFILIFFLYIKVHFNFNNNYHFVNGSG